MSESVWIALCGVLALLLVWTWTRGRPPAPASPKEKEKSTGATKPAAAAPKAPVAPPAPAPDDIPVVPRLEYEDDEEVDPTKVGETGFRRPALQPPTKRIVYDEDAAEDEPTHSGALILLTAIAQTDRGLRRKRNEDSVLAMPEHGVYVVADGMGGYRGGEIASALAVSTIEKAFNEGQFAGDPHDTLPVRASELARAMQMANEAILQRAEQNRELEGMGTTVCATRFTPNKQRMYVGHVGDSRLYRVRDGALEQVTTDHTMRDLGVTGAAAAHLSRAIGVWPTVPIDIVLGKPRPGDVYILCSDGLTKMVPDAKIGEIAGSGREPAEIVSQLIDTANAAGGKDNISVIVIRVVDPATVGRPAPARS